jgi:hypothetical protein
MFSPETLAPVTTASRATGETPFFLVYGVEACLPRETLMGSPRVQSFDESMQEQLWREDVGFHRQTQMASGNPKCTIQPSARALLPAVRA